jgi:hypothetical protein
MIGFVRRSESTERGEAKRPMIVEGLGKGFSRFMRRWV